MTMGPGVVHLQHRSVVSGLLLLFGVVFFFRVVDPTPIPAMLMLPLDPIRKGDDFLRGEPWLLFFDFLRGCARGGEPGGGVVVGGGSAGKCCSCVSYFCGLSSSLW